MLVDFSMWKGDGTLALSSYPSTSPEGFSVASLPPNLRGLLTQLKVGSHVRFWVPRAALAGWRPPQWPDADLVFEFELLGVTHVTITDMHGNSVDPQPGLPPDAAGPPATAEKTASGLRYIYLDRATKVNTAKPGDRVELSLDAYAVNGVEVNTLRTGIKTATTLERAPGKLGEVLRKLNSGDRVRIWVPKVDGGLIIPEGAGHETIIDLGVSFAN
ncbi:MAG: hypothetical protein ABI335_21120 [Polyangiaceae bacterium]